jgi:hypothetical protein
VANVLPVPAGQVGHPIAMLVLMKPDDGLPHDDDCPDISRPGPSRQAFEDQRQPTDGRNGQDGHP